MSDIKRFDSDFGQKNITRKTELFLASYKDEDVKSSDSTAISQYPLHPLLVCENNDT
jgi:hypothetical protein